MKCEICGTLIKKIEDLLICANGHTIQNSQIVAHEEFQPPVKTVSHRVRKEKKEKKLYINDGCYLMRLMLFKFLINEAKVFLKFKNDDIFKYFTTFFNMKNKNLDSFFRLNKKEFFVLIYMCKRAHNESLNLPYFFKDCKKDYQRFDISNRLISLISRYPLLEPVVKEFSHLPFDITIVTCKTTIDYLTDKYKYLSSFRNKIKLKGSAFEEKYEIAKSNIRRMFRNDLQMANIYFKEFCKYLDVVITSEIQLYFEKFIYTFDPNILIIPEVDFSFFLAAYFIHRGEFENSNLERKILMLFQITKLSLYEKLENFCNNLQCVSPELFISELIQRNNKRFDVLRESIEFIDAYKRSLNYKKN